MINPKSSHAILLACSQFSTPKAAKAYFFPGFWAVPAISSPAAKLPGDLTGHAHSTIGKSQITVWILDFLGDWRTFCVWSPHLCWLVNAWFHPRTHFLLDLSPAPPILGKIHTPRHHGPICRATELKAEGPSLPGLEHPVTIPQCKLTEMWKSHHL